MLFPTSPWPQKLPSGVSQLLCLFWPRPLLPATAARPWACSRSISHHHVHQTLTITSGMRWSSRSCQRRSPQTNPLSVLRKTLVHHEEIYTLAKDVKNNNNKKTTVQHCLWSAGFQDEQDVLSRPEHPGIYQE